MTQAEEQIARLLVKGWSNLQIANARNTSEHTVKNQLTGIYSKLEVTTDREATVKLRDIFDAD